MSEKCSQHKVYDVHGLLLGEYKNTMRGSLITVLLKNLLEHFYSLFRLQLPLDHCVKNEIHDREQRANFFIGELILHTIVKVDIMKI